MDLGRVYDDHAGALFHYLYGLLRNRADAEDALQEVFVRLASRLRWGDPIDDVRAYLFVSARNEALRALGRRKPPCLPPDLFEPSGESADVEGVSRALDALPPEQIEVVLLHVYEGLTFAEVARVMNTSQHTAASRYRYALESLRELLHGPGSATP